MADPNTSRWTLLLKVLWAFYHLLVYMTDYPDLHPTDNLGQVAGTLVDLENEIKEKS